MTRQRMQQLDLFGLAIKAPTPEPLPPKGRPDPLVWIAEVHILRDYDASENALIRRLSLRRGLNVLWAPPTPEGVENRLGDGQITGHTAGKTTFCRFIRYLLGETRFGTARNQEKIREALPDGWVVGEVFVNNCRWVVGRPFAIGHHPFAVRDLSFSQALSERGRGGYQEFLAALASAVVEPVPVKELPHGREAIAWEHVLAWLTRDQESRFAGLVEWRDSSSESESPRLVLDDRHVVIRALCGLMSDEEGEAQRRYEDLTLEKQKLEDAAPLLGDRASEDRKRLAKLLEIDDEPTDAGPLFAVRFHERVAVRKRAAEVAEASLLTQTSDVESAEEAAREASEACGMRVEALRLLEAKRSDLKTQKREAKAARVALLAMSPPVCGVPLETAIAKGCKLSAKHQAGAPTASEVAQNEREELAALDAQIADAKRELVEARAAQKTSASEHGQKRAALATERERIARERAAIEEVERLYGYMANATFDADGNTQKLAQVTDEVKASSELQAALRREQEEALTRLSDRFREVSRALLGDHVDARVEVKNRRVELHVEDRGERDGAAMQTIKLLAFDLAALKLGVDGFGQFPGLLVHDGPREADMDGRIYERLFLYARQLELNADPALPGFQYIVTTTAPPPKEMQKAPYMIEPLLDASKPEGRLLKMDL